MKSTTTRDEGDLGDAGDLGNWAELGDLGANATRRRARRSPKVERSMIPPREALPQGTGKLRKVLTAAVFGGLTFGAAALAAPVSKKKVWYGTLLKSKATPPSWVFGPVWTALYGAIAYAGYRTWMQPSSPRRTRALTLWGTQMALNASWSPLFFGAHRPKASALVAGAMVPTIAAYSLTARKVDKLAAVVMLPYLGWSLFAAYLNAQIVRKNAFRL